MIKKLINTAAFWLCVTGGNFSCTSTPEQEEPLLEQQRTVVFPLPEAEPLPKDYRRPYAELIQPKTLSTFGHLAGYEGHALIGNSRVQAVISGVDPQDAQNIWSPLILAYYHRSEGKWQKIDSVFETSFRRNVAGRPAPTQIEAVVPSNSPRYDAAHLDVVYSRAGGGSKREFLKLYLDDASDELIITIDTETISKTPTLEKNRVTLRLHRQGGEIIQLPYGLTHYATNDILTIAGSDNFTESVERDGRFVAFKSPGTNAAGWEGFIIGIGPQAGAEAHFNSITRSACFEDATSAKLAREQTNITKFFEVIRHCQATMPRGELLVRLDRDRQPLDPGFRRFTLNDTQGALLGYTFGQTGSTLRFPLVPNHEYMVKEMSTGAEWGTSTPIAVGAGGAEILSLSPRKLAEVEVNIASGPDTPAALLTIRSGIDPAGINFTSDAVLTSAGTRMSDSVMLVRSWPVKLSLPAGKYSFEFFREGTANSICSFLADVSEEETKTLTCPTLAEKPPGPAKSTTIDTDTPSNIASVESLKDALAVQRVTVNGTDARAAAGAPSDIKKLEVFDPRSLLSLSSYPLDNEIIRAWRRTSGKNQTDLVLFSEFIRSKAPDAILQLNCPSNNLSGSELKIWLERLKPNAIQYYGCDTRSDTRQAFDQLFRQANPPLITPVSGLRSGSRTAFYPRLILSAPAPNTENAVKTSIAQGAFVISAGSTIEVKELSAQLLRNRRRRVSAKLRIASDEQVIPLTLTVYAGTEIIYEKSLPLAPGRYIDENIEFLSPLTNVRFEVNGRLRDQPNNVILPAQFTLASTNYVRVTR